MHEDYFKSVRFDIKNSTLRKVDQDIHQKVYMNAFDYKLISQMILLQIQRQLERKDRLFSYLII